MGMYQDKVKQLCIDNGWQCEDLLTLGLGLAEEAGEIAGAINNLNPLYVPGTKDSVKDRKYQDLEKELKDCLNYLCSIANKIGVDLGI